MDSDSAGESLFPPLSVTLPYRFTSICCSFLFDWTFYFSLLLHFQFYCNCFVCLFFPSCHTVYNLGKEEVAVSACSSSRYGCFMVVSTLALRKQNCVIVFCSSFLWTQRAAVYRSVDGVSRTVSAPPMILRRYSERTQVKIRGVRSLYNTDKTGRNTTIFHLFIFFIGGILSD